MEKNKRHGQKNWSHIFLHACPYHPHICESVTIITGHGVHVPQGKQAWQNRPRQPTIASPFL
jgi:hypothetical protein